MPLEQLAKLSPERRRLLELKLRKQRTSREERALPFGGLNRETYRLFCFPHAGGGAAFFRSLSEPLKEFIQTAPVQYPGRENRREEAYAQSIEELVQTLLADLRGAFLGRFAFFGHSMGAIVAFEMMRALRRAGLPLPEVLVASAARAPQFRRNNKPAPDPSREELIEQVRNLEGLPEDILAHGGLVDLLLPSLEADTSLYRRYIYREEPPFETAITVIGGRADPNIHSSHLDAWKEQTRGRFECIQIDGGHFYLRSNPPAFFEILREAVGLCDRR
jgi:surfactin synthase thioesterase subunit